MKLETYEAAQKLLEKRDNLVKLKDVFNKAREARDSVTLILEDSYGITSNRIAGCKVVGTDTTIKKDLFVKFIELIDEEIDKTYEDFSELED